MVMSYKEWEILTDLHDEVSGYVLQLCPYPKMELEELEKQKGKRCKGCDLSRVCDVLDDSTDVLFSNKYHDYLIRQMRRWRGESHQAVSNP